MNPLRLSFRLLLIPLTTAITACGGVEEGLTSDGPLDEVSQEVLQSGIATYYAATGEGNCSYDASPNDLMVAAMNTPQYANSAACGQCVDVQGPKGSVRVRIVDRCPTCQSGHLDLSEQAFAKIADLAQGRVNINWNVVPCNVSGNVKYHFMEGSTQWWTAIQVRNHKHGITKLEWRRGTGAWQNIPRQNYNYFVVSGGVGAGAFSLRVTATTGAQLVDNIPAVLDNAAATGAAQFP